jgi:hypothetical protein
MKVVEKERKMAIGALLTESERGRYARWLPGNWFVVILAQTDQSEREECVRMLCAYLVRDIVFVGARHTKRMLEKY